MNSKTTEMFEIEYERYELFEPGPAPLEMLRRDFFRVLGGGLVVLCLLRESDAQQPQAKGGRRGGGGAPMPQEISAWLHIAEDGKITAYTGKAEVGQNIRTSLSQAVAEELRVPVASVELVMGDTARTPFDMGTFGSRTTPSMFPQLRKAAAAARVKLTDLAAEQLKTEASGLNVADGKVSHAPSGRALSYGELTHGQKLMKAIQADVALTPADHWETCGHSLAKVDGLEFVTGKHQYASDVKREGMLRGKVLRPPSYGATLTKLDAKGAEAMPGVVVVHEGDFVGVVAPDERTAERALAAIKADWKPKPQPSQKTLFDDLKKPSGNAGRGGGGFGGPSRGEQGHFDDAFKQAEVKLERTFTIAYIAHAPLEPRAAVAEWNGDGVTVWTGTQRPFGVRGELAQLFGLSDDKVHVIVPDTGAGYGGKHTGEAALEAARLAKAARKPVKLVWTREEEFTWAYFRPAGVIETACGATKDGKLTAWRQENYNSGPSGLPTPYHVANRREAFHGSESPLRQGSYRALASTANHFARETLIDELAHELKADPVKFRLQNLGDQPNAKRLAAVLEAAAKQFGWGGAAPAQGRAFGVACGEEKGGYVATCAEVEVDPEGKVRVVRLVSAFECGAVVNPDHLKNQVEGAHMMGLGGALFEAIQFDDGKIKNARFSRYRVPRFSDAPTIDVVLVDRKDLPSAGAGETPIVAVAPAIGNAIFKATGKRLTSLPLAPNGVKA